MHPLLLWLALFLTVTARSDVTAEETTTPSPIKTGQKQDTAHAPPVLLNDSEDNDEELEQFQTARDHLSRLKRNALVYHRPSVAYSPEDDVPLYRQCCQVASPAPCCRSMTTYVQFMSCCSSRRLESVVVSSSSSSVACCESASPPACCGSPSSSVSITLRAACCAATVVEVPVPPAPGDCCSVAERATCCARSPAMTACCVLPQARDVKHELAGSCCSAVSKAVCCANAAAQNVRVMCCSGTVRHVRRGEEGSSCCSASVRQSCCAAAVGQGPRPRCCPTEVLEIRGLPSGPECCSIAPARRENCCSRAMAVAAVIPCCSTAKAGQVSRVEIRSQCCGVTVVSERRACCVSAGSSSACCSSGELAALEVVEVSDCCTVSRTVLRPACCSTARSVQARTSCCQQPAPPSLYPRHESCCGLTGVVRITRCCQGIGSSAVLYSPCCATIAVTAPSFPPTTTTTTTTTTTPDPTTPFPPCCVSSSPSYRDQCCSAVSEEFIVMLPCCASSRSVVVSRSRAVCCPSGSPAGSFCCGPGSRRCCPPSQPERQAVQVVERITSSCCGSGLSVTYVTRCCEMMTLMHTHVTLPACCRQSAAPVVVSQQIFPYRLHNHPDLLTHSYQHVEVRDDVRCCSAAARVRCCVNHVRVHEEAPPSCCASVAASSRRYYVARSRSSSSYSCCHTPAAIRIGCCSSSAYLAPCCQTMRRRYR